MPATTDFDTLIIGAGPGGLSCAAAAARAGLRVAVLERSHAAGRKVCAGGITAHGLLNRLPPELLEKKFYRQIIATPHRRVVIDEPQPIIATVNRERLGGYHADQAAAAGVELIFGARALRIEGSRIFYQRAGQEKQVSSRYLVGADGSHSLVRDALKLPTQRLGIGITYYLDRTSDEMVWNFDSRRFGCGYSWLFPHQQKVSAGVFSGSRRISARVLKDQLNMWLKSSGIEVEHAAVRADLVNHDFRGWRFGSTFLIGDAAGMASPLTGEGIYPAVISGETVAAVMAGTETADSNLKSIIEKHHKHRIMLTFAQFHPWLASFLAESAVVLLRHRFLPPSAFEMV